MKNSDPTNAASDNADHGRISHDSLHDDMCLFFEMSHDLFTVVSSEGRFLSVNNAWENLLGYSKDDLLKQSYTDFLHPDDVESSGREFARAFDGSDIRRFINRFRCKDGSVLWLEWYGKISADRKTMTLVGRDITDRKLLEGKLFEQENVKDVIATAVRDAIILLDNSGNIIFWNDASVAILGYTREEVMGRNLHKIMVPERYLALHRKAFRAFRETGYGAVIGKTNELAALHKNGYEIPIEISLSAVKIKGEWCSVGIIRDISERKKLDNILNDRLKELNCHYSISEVLGWSDITVEEACEKIVNIVPSGFRYSEVAGASIQIYDKVFRTENFLEEGKILRQEISIDGNTVGVTMVSYPADKVMAIDMDFLPEESLLLFSIAERIGNFADKKSKEIALSASEEKYRMLAENVSDVIWVYNLSRKRFTYYSPSVVQLQGFTADEAMQLGVDQMNTPESAEMLKAEFLTEAENLKRKKSKRQNRYYEIQQYHKDGSIIWVGINTQMRTNNSGEVEIFGISRNIDERKRAEQLLIASEKKLNATFDILDVGIFITDDKGKLINCNLALEKIFKATREELLRWNVNAERWPAIRPDLSPMPVSESASARAINGKQPVRDVVMGLLKPDGSVTWVTVNAAPLELPGIGIVATLIDITEQKEAEDRLKASEKKFRLMFENAQDIYVQTDLDGNILEIGPAIRKVLLYSREELIGKSVRILYQDPDQRQAYLKALKKQGELFDYELALHTKNNDPVTVSLNAHYLFDKNNQVIGMEGSMRDISERKLAEEAIRRQAELLDLARDSVIVRDMDSRIIYWNQGAVERYGWTSGEAKGRIIHELLKTTFPCPREAIINELAQKGYWEGELTHTIKDGSQIVVSSRWQLHKNAEDQTVEIFEINNDITERKKAELQLIKLTEELKGINATKDKLFSIIAHDLRGPIGNFNQILELLTSERVLDESLKIRLMEELKKAAKSTFSLLDNLLNWSRIQTNSIKIDPKSLLLFPLIAENVELLSPSAVKKEIELINDADYFVSAWCDKDTVDLVIRNFISNAIKFTPRDGTVTISAVEKEEFVEVQIKDTGIGMSKEVADNLFNSAFYSTYGTEQEKGSGLGLALCKDFIERNGGRLSVESAPGAGSIFRFTLPKPERFR